MSRQRAPAWYVHADTLGLAHAMKELRDDVTFPGDTGERANGRWHLPPCPVTGARVDDDVWIPIVARLGLAIITRDKHIQTRTSEIDAVAASNARMFAITSDENLTRWGLVEVVVSRWRDMESEAAEPGPYIYSITRTTIRPVVTFDVLPAEE